MNEKPYHHGNLENMLIEEGIKQINAEGFQNLSLRKIAAICGVSHTAPYKHFANKETLLAAIQNYVMNQFSEVLEESLRIYEKNPDKMFFLGKAYLDFFLKNPHYFRFFISHSGGQVDLSDLTSISEYRPFEIFKKAAAEYLETAGVPQAYQQQAIISMWAMVHGITSMATMNGVNYNGDWSKLLESILKQNIISKGAKNHES